MAKKDDATDSPPVSVPLLRYDAARVALEAASKIDEVKSIHDKAVAMAAYAKQAKDNDMVNWAVEIKVRAERRAGELLKAMPKNVGGQSAHKLKPANPTGSKKEPVENNAQTLAQQGISKKESMTWQKLAEIPESVFEKKLVAVQKQGEKLTTKAVLDAKPAPKKAPSSPTAHKPSFQPQDWQQVSAMSWDKGNPSKIFFMHFQKQLSAVLELLTPAQRVDLCGQIVAWATQVQVQETEDEEEA